MNRERGVLVKCQDCLAQQPIRTPDHSREMAETFAGLLDGTSPLYAIPPDENWQIGACGFCGGRIKATLFGYGDDANRAEVRR